MPMPGPGVKASPGYLPESLWVLSGECSIKHLALSNWHVEDRPTVLQAAESPNCSCDESSRSSA